MDTSISKRANAVLMKRTTASRGRIEKVLGKRGVFGELLCKAVRQNHESILANPFLEKDLKAYKRIIQALERRSDDAEIADLLTRLRAEPRYRNKPSMLCPIWRHEQYLEAAYTALTRYIFDAVFPQCFFATVVFDYAPNLFAVEESLLLFRQKLDTAERIMSKSQRGLMMFGSFEPDLRSARQIIDGDDTAKAIRQLDWSVQDHGGWVTSAHLVGRAVQLQEFEATLHNTFPSDGWARVKVSRLDQDKAVLDSILDISSYLLKYPKRIFKSDTTKGEGRRAHDKAMRKLQASFIGQSMPELNSSGEFNHEAAIRQWALFTDRMGPANLRYSVENAYAQKWLSASETAWFARNEQFDWLHGYSEIEVHRDSDRARQSLARTRDPKPKRRIKRSLRYDEEWIEKTDWSSMKLSDVPRFWM